MKKYYSVIVALMIVATTSVSLISCGDDDDDNEVLSNSLVGKWGLTHKYSKWGTRASESGERRAGESGESDRDVEKYGSGYNELYFSTDGTCEYIEYDWRGNIDEHNTGTYTLSGTKLQISYAMSVLNIQKLTKDSLIVEYGTTDYYERLSYARIE
ncbi:MAG: lipocalin family protein [Prevotella sp.]|nr:lipocalin family protein [Prevotella sp.]